MLALQSEAPGAGWHKPHGANPEFDPEVRPAELVFRDASFEVRLVPEFHLFDVDFGPKQWPVSVLLPENAPIRLLYFFLSGAAFEERVFVLEPPGQQKGVDGLKICDIVV